MRDEPSAGKAGSVMLDFLQRLVGSKAKDMKLQGDVVDLVKFNPKELLATLGQVVTALGNCPAASVDSKTAFLDAMCGEQEALKVLQKTYKNLGKCGVGSGVLEGVAALTAAVSTKVALSAAAASASTDGSAEDPGGAIVLFKIDDATVAIYERALGGMSMREADMGCGGGGRGGGGAGAGGEKDDKAAIAHYYGSEIEGSPMDARTGRAKMRALGKNIKAFRETGVDGKGALPCRPEASAFMLCDTTRMDVFKFILSGPTETPYSFGLFEFHMFAPNTFPDAPPVVNLRTTGGGLVRFHPNLCKYTRNPHLYLIDW
jgi:hypothetical protein